VSLASGEHRMSFDSPFASEAQQEKNRRLRRWLVALVLGLIAFSIVYIIFTN
jgi:hypothetical protein